MQNGHPFTEAGPETPFGLRDQGDFGNQHQDALPAAKGGGRGLQIDLGFTAAGDTVQEDGGEALPAGRIDGFQGRLLLRGQLRGPIRQDGLAKRIAVNIRLGERDQPASGHGADDGRSPRDRVLKRPEGQFHFAVQEVEDLPALGRDPHTLGKRADAPDQPSFFGARAAAA